MSVLLTGNASEVSEKAGGGSVRIGVVNGASFEGDRVADIAQQACSHAEIEVYRRGIDALMRVGGKPVDLWLVGLELPDMDGLDLLGIMNHCGPSSRSLLLAGRFTEMACLRLSEDAADGFFDCSEEKGPALGTAILRILDGGGYESSPLREVRRRALAGRVSLDRLLSNVEMLVMSALADGSDDHVAGGLLGMNAATVHTHRQRIMKKLGSHNRIELTAEAGLRGMVRRGADETVIRPAFSLFLNRHLGRKTSYGAACGMDLSKKTSPSP